MPLRGDFLGDLFLLALPVCSIQLCICHTMLRCVGLICGSRD
jgi:hypothetical protein